LEYIYENHTNSPSRSDSIQNRRGGVQKVKTKAFSQ